MTPFAGWGASKVLVMAVARDRCLFAIYWGNALDSIPITATFLLIILQFVGRYALPISAATLIPGLRWRNYSSMPLGIPRLGISGIRKVEGTAGVRLLGLPVRMLACCVFRAHGERAVVLNVGPMGI